MHPLTPQDILALWDRGSRLHPLERALSILGAGCPEASVHELARLPLDERDHLLLELRVLTFGARLEAVVGCPECREWLELQLPCDAMLQAPTSLDQGAAVELQVDGTPVAVRVPTSEDLLAVRAARSRLQARACLLDRCVEVEPPGRLTTEQRGRALDELAERMPHVEILIELACASCGHAWCEPFDMGEYLWIEIRAQARRLLFDVHGLALAYGWRESDVLGMSPLRRQAYLAMVQA